MRPPPILTQGRGGGGTGIGAVIGALLLSSVLAVAGAADAQPRTEPRRLGFLAGGSSTLSSPLVGAFRDGLRDLGWIDGQNVVIDFRFAEGKFDRLPDLASELVVRNVDLVVAVPTPAALAARNASATVPIVMISVPDPVEIGLVASLARPGGNVTGVAFSVGIDIIGKGLQVLKEAVPHTRRVAILLNPTNPGHALTLGKVTADARSLGLSLHFMEARSPEDFEGAFAAMVKGRADALLVVADSMFQAHRTRLAALATANRLPSISAFREYVDAGGLVSYGPNLMSQYRQAAAYVDRILKGANPANLPVEQPTTFELVVNLKTAKALGLAVPRSLLLKADHVVE